MRASIGYGGEVLDGPVKDLELPEPQTCGTCAYFRRCRTLGYTASPERTSCDFFPVRWCAAPPSPPTDHTKEPDRE